MRRVYGTVLGLSDQSPGERAEPTSFDLNLWTKVQISRLELLGPVSRVVFDIKDERSHRAKPWFLCPRLQCRGPPHSERNSRNYCCFRFEN